MATRGARTDLLILHVASARPATVARIVQSIAAVGSAASWLLMLHDGSGSNHTRWETARRAARAVPTSLLVRTGTRPPLAKKLVSSRPLIPKLIFWLQALAHIASHRYVWLADEDISFNGFDLGAYMARVRSIRPLVSQPLIRARAVATNGDPNGKWEEMLNTQDTWRGYYSRHVGAVEVSYVEQQAALVDARFFVAHAADWHALAKMQIEHASDFGADTMWCGAAALYLEKHGTRHIAEEYASRPTPRSAAQEVSRPTPRSAAQDASTPHSAAVDADRALRPAPPRVPCALVLVPIVHDDSRVLNWTSPSTIRKFWARSYKLEVLARTQLDGGRAFWARQQEMITAMRAHELAAAASGECTPPRADEARADNDDFVAVRKCRGPWRLTSTPASSLTLPCAIAELPCFPHCYNHIGRTATCDDDSSRSPSPPRHIAPSASSTHATSASPTLLAPVSFCYPNHQCSRSEVWSMRGARRVIINATLHAVPSGELCCAHLVLARRPGS